MIDRTTPADLMHLATDLPGSPMQVAAVLVLGAGPVPGLPAVRDAIGRRLPAVPRLRQRLVRTPPGGGRPVWVDDPDFAVDHHVGAVRCAAPGDEEALLAIAAGTVARRLPRTRPLWAATLVTDLAGGRSALVVTLHHVLADGIGGLAVLARLVDGAPTAPGTGFPRPPPSRRDLVADAAVARLRSLSRVPAGLRRLGTAVAELVAGAGARVPRSSLNRPTGPRRSLAVARADLAAVRRVAHDHGATVNDVVLTAVTGALHATLRHRGENAGRFVVSVPVAVRRGAVAGALGNRVGVMPVPVVVAGRPGQRLAAIARTTRERRPADPAASAALIGPVFRLLAAAGAARWFVDRQRRVTTMVTDLRGPETRLHFLGVPIVDVVPVSPITGNVTAGFAALSYAGTLVLTVVADPAGCPDLPFLRASVQAELDRLTGDPTTGG